MVAEIGIVDEGILLMANIDEGRIESRHNLTHLAQIDIAHGKTRLALLLIQLNEDLIFTQGDRYLGRSNVYNQFSIHISVVLRPQAELFTPSI